MFWVKHRRLILWIIYILFFLHAAMWYCLGYKGVGHLGFGEFFLTLRTGIITTGTIFCLLVFIHAMFFGGIFCGWFCHWGITQDAAAWLMKKCGIKPIMRHLDSKIIPWVWFIILIFQVIFYWYFNGLPASLSFNPSYTEMWSGVPRAILMICMTLIISGFTLIFLFGERAFCRSICTFRLWFRWFEKIAPYKIRRINDCKSCSNECSNSCFMDIDVAKEVRTNACINSDRCVKCFKCMGACPHGVLKASFKKTGLEKKEPVEENLPLFNFKDGLLQGALAIAALHFIGFTIGGNMSLSTGFLLGFLLIYVWHAKKLGWFELLVVSLASAGLYFANDMNDVTSLAKGLTVIALFLAIARYVGFKGGFEFLNKPAESRKAPVALVAMAILFATYTGGLEVVASFMIHQAKAALVQKDYQTYSSTMEKWADYASDPASAHFNLAKVQLLELKQYDKALENLKKSLDMSYRKDLALDSVRVFLDQGLAMSAKKLALYVIETHKDDSQELRNLIAVAEADMAAKKAAILGTK